MRENTANSVVLSLALHGFVVGAIVLATFFLAKRAKEMPVIFELVAGPATAPDELVAPALGNTTKQIKLDVPIVETIASMPDPEPVVHSEPEEAAVEPPPAAEKPKPVEKAKPVPKPKPDNSMANEVKKTQRMSYKDYLKKHPTPKRTPSTISAPRKTAKGPRVDATGIAQGVKGGSTANTKGGGGGTALSREMQDKMSTYISLLIQELKRAHEPPPGVNDRLEARVTFDITASGAIMNPRISKTSGDKAFDESVLEAFLRMRSIGPTPNRRSDTWTVTFRMRDVE
jgi:TonB family protein